MFSTGCVGTGCDITAEQHMKTLSMHLEECDGIAAARVRGAEGGKKTSPQSWGTSCWYLWCTCFIDWWHLGSGQKSPRHHLSTSWVEHERSMGMSMEQDSLTSASSFRTVITLVVLQAVYSSLQSRAQQQMTRLRLRTGIHLNIYCFCCDTLKLSQRCKTTSWKSQ